MQTNKIRSTQKFFFSSTILFPSLGAFLLATQVGCTGLNKRLSMDPNSPYSPLLSGQSSFSGNGTGGKEDKRENSDYDYPRSSPRLIKEALEELNMLQTLQAFNKWQLDIAKHAHNLSIEVNNLAKSINTNGQPLFVCLPFPANWSENQTYNISCQKQGDNSLSYEITTSSSAWSPTSSHSSGSSANNSNSSSENSPKNLTQVREDTSSRGNSQPRNGNWQNVKQWFCC